MTRPTGPADPDITKPPIAPTGENRWIDRGHNVLWLVGILWLECVLIWLVWYWGSFADLGFRDPDDAMRLVQVRDFLAGQSWFDVSQHRVNPPVGGPMHWSRLVDLPIAGMILLLRPFAGQPLAEIIACVTVPMLTLAIICFGMFAALRDFLGKGRALLAIALLVTSFPILTQLAPLRIDHHGWQIAMAVGLLGGMLHPDPRKGGWIMGLSIALWMHISSEGLPYAAIAGAVLALRHAARAAEGPRLLRYTAVMAGGSAVLMLATHGWRESLVVHCDAMSPVYLAPLLLLSAILLIGQRIAGNGTILRRLLPVTLAGTAAALLFLGTGGTCLAGPFRTLDPVVYDFWYKGVLEGLPLWDQEPTVAAIVIAPALFGIVGLGIAALAEQDSYRRMQWLSILGLALGSFAVSVLVLRAMSVSHLYALIGNMWVIARLYPGIAARTRMMERVLLTVALSLLTPVGIALTVSGIAGAVTGRPATPPKEKTTCLTPAEAKRLDRLPTTTLFAPIDLGPNLLLRTRHDVIGTAHHRNVEGLGKVIHAFLGTPDEAHPIILSTQARYVLLCSDLAEMHRYVRVAPNGLAARIGKGDVPKWLTPLALPGLKTVRLYRIDRAPVTPPRTTAPRH